MKRLILIVACLLGGFTSLFGQDGQDFIGGSFAFTTGYMNFNSEKLNAFLPEQFEGFDSDHLLLGGNAYVLFNQLMIGLHGNTIVSQAKTASSLRTSIYGGNAFLDLGYDLVKGKQIALIPQIGIGGGTILVSTARNGNITLDDVSDLEFHENNSAWSSMMFDLGFGFDWYGVADVTDDNVGGIRLGAKIGYQFSIANDDWRYIGGNIAGGPEFGLNGFYVQLAVGLGGFSNK